MISRIFGLSRPLSLRLTLVPFCHGNSDPCARFQNESFLFATRTPDGPSTLRLELIEQNLKARAWGPGAEWMIEQVPQLIGEHQSDGDFQTDNSVVRELHRKMQGLRIPRSQLVFEALFPAILEQRVTGMEAKRAFRNLTKDYGEPAPGPFDLFLQPLPELLAGLPYWKFHKYGVEKKRADAIRRAANNVAQLEKAAGMPFEEARRRLQVIPGIGRWTSAIVSLTALGDPDAVIEGDFHIPNEVAWTLAGEPRGSDERMLELLEPFQGQRGLVTRLLTRSAQGAPKFGPRYNPIPIASY